MNGLRAFLGEDEGTRAWLDHLDGIGEPDFEVALPSADDLPSLLVRLAVPHEDVDELVALRPTRERSRRRWTSCRAGRRSNGRSSTT